jgi:hypothetical protein
VAQACSHCGSSDTCNCAVIGGRGINVGGNGSVGSPYAVALASETIDQTIWCDALGTPIGYSTTNLEGEQTFFSQNGTQIGNVKPETFFECKCDCVQPGGGGGGPVLLNPAYLQYDAFSQIRFIDDGTTSIAGGLSGPDVQLLYDQRASAPLSMTGPFTGLATESQLRRTSSGDLYTLPAFVRTAQQASSIITLVSSSLGPGTWYFSTTATLTVTNPSALYSMFVLISSQSHAGLTTQTQNAQTISANLTNEISVNGGAYATYRSNYYGIRTISGDFSYYQGLSADRVGFYPVAAGASITFQARTSVNLSGPPGYLQTVTNPSTDLIVVGFVGGIV